MGSLFEQMGGTYHQEGDVLIPGLVLSDTTDHHIGKYGRMRHGYLKEHRRTLFTIMLTNETLAKHVADIDANLPAGDPVISARPLGRVFSFSG